MTELKRRLIEYQLSMSIARSMLKKGIIKRSEYDKIDTIIAQKHGISLCSIFRKIP